MSTPARLSGRAIRWPGCDDADLRLQVEQADADYSSAKGALDQQQAEERRIATLKVQGWTSAADVDKIKAGADQARGAFARAERAVTLARNAVSYATLDADADGIVSAVLAEPGQVVAAGAPVLRLSHTAEQEAAVAIPESLVDPRPSRRRVGSNSGRCLASR